MYASSKANYNNVACSFSLYRDVCEPNDNMFYVKSMSREHTDHLLVAKDVAWRGVYCLLVEPYNPAPESDEKIMFITSEKILVPYGGVPPNMTSINIQLNEIADEGFYPFHGAVSNFHL